MMFADPFARGPRPDPLSQTGRRAFKALAPLSQTVISILTETVPAVLSRKNPNER
ncbi:hypothetical protein ALC60_03632 [Trachymyrmex zeteki]|uniref:Uncharacterized protein n=1 Tax=Mycetomoellerius zeteki TaxID=64791 RepID=A0A151XAC1_9HYME|nr:hypothetical protein ALC60_03632 [Trachymyrmex zeteki]